MTSTFETGESMVKATQTKEREQSREIEIVDLAPDGLGYGEGSISVQAQLEDPEKSGLTPEVLRVGAEIIKSGVAFVEVDKDANGDGCGDGRPARSEERRVG